MCNFFVILHAHVKLLINTYCNIMTINVALNYSYNSFHTDGSYRGKKLINLKEISDDAMEMCKKK